MLERTAALLFDHSLFNAHPRFFGYITAPPAPIGILGDFLASALNANVGGWMLAPAATEIEAQTVSWIASLIGYPADCGGLLVSGGNMANFVCFLAARAASAHWNLRERGVVGESGQRLRVYASAETHTWIQKAADLAGLGTASIRWIPTDADLRMNVDALRQQIEADVAAGDVPCVVVGTAGSVSTGASTRCVKSTWSAANMTPGFTSTAPTAASRRCCRTPPTICGRCQRPTPSLSIRTNGCMRRSKLGARSCGVRMRSATRLPTIRRTTTSKSARRTTWTTAPRIRVASARSRCGWRCRHAGAAAYRGMIADDIQLSQAMAAAIDRHPELQLFTQSLSITTFRYVPSDLRPALGDEAVEHHLDALNRELLDRLQRGGEAFVSNAVVGGRYLLRACIVNFHTARSDVEALPDIVARAGRVVDADLRPITHGP